VLRNQAYSPPRITIIDSNLLAIPVVRLPVHMPYLHGRGVKENYGTHSKVAANSLLVQALGLSRGGWPGSGGIHLIGRDGVSPRYLRLAEAEDGRTSRTLAKHMA
jgi:hypothetical protein